jgi:CSLREA domain-containing protein
MSARQRALAILAVLALAGPVAAAQFTVNSQADVPDANPGNGVCNPVNALPGVCTLRAAIMEANALAGNDTLFLTAGQTYTLTRVGQDDNAVNGDLDINSNIIIIFLSSGVRPVVDAGVAERAFEIHSGNVTLFGFDITGGNAVLPTDAAGGGVAVNFGAGIVQLSLLRFYDNRARFGGGLYNDGAQTTVTLSEFFDNAYGGGIGETQAGSAIRNRGILVLNQSSVHGNSGLNGNAGTIVHSEPGGPGVGSITVINTTISGNTGIGLFTTDAENVVLRNTTIAGNSGIGLRFGGVNTALTMRNTMVARNNVGGAVGNCQLSQAGSASYNTNRYNLDSDGTCNLAGGSSNFSAVNPRLTPLKSRGSFNPIHWPRPDSPIIDAGHPVIGAIGCEDTDQHATDRPQDFGSAPDNNCDVGAAEIRAESIFFDSNEIL